MTNEAIEKWICDYMADPAHNTMKELPYPAWEEPLVGFSRAEDPLYAFYQQHIDPEFYLRPEQWLEKAYGHAFDPKCVSVISWALPQTRDTHIKCQTQTDCPTIEWQMARVHGENCNRNLARALEQHLISLGYEALAPMCSDEFSWGKSDKFLLISNWSERHTALISGLGTFGLCGGLISAKGKAARYGSVIVNLPLDPTPRPYTQYNEYCQAQNGCTACIRRCPAGAISIHGHDKQKCQEYHKTVIEPLCRSRYDYTGYAVCGLCQTNVPCEWGIPGKK